MTSASQRIHIKALFFSRSLSCYSSFHTSCGDFFEGADFGLSKCLPFCSWNRVPPVRLQLAGERRIPRLADHVPAIPNVAATLKPPGRKHASEPLLLKNLPLERRCAVVSSRARSEQRRVRAAETTAVPMSVPVPGVARILAEL